MVEIVDKDNFDIPDCREVNAIFSISSAKPGNGVEQLRDGNLETFWQSDGFAPHIINIQLTKKTCLTKLCLYIDFSLDESYTPKKFSIKSGTHLHDLIEVTSFELHDPSGWVIVPLTDTTTPTNNFGGGSVIESDSVGIRTHFLQVRVHSMHQNGRDTHIRQIKLLGPRISAPVMGSFVLDDFKTVDMSQYALLR